MVQILLLKNIFFLESFCLLTFLQSLHPCVVSIVRPVKRDWAVLSKDTPMDISILKSVGQCVFIHL